MPEIQFPRLTVRTWRSSDSERLGAKHDVVDGDFRHARFSGEIQLAVDILAGECTF